MRTRVFGKPLGIAALIVVAYAGLIASASADTKVPAAVAEAATAAPRVKSPVKATVGKPVAPIAIDYELSAEPALGVPFDMRITASSMGITDLTLSLRADEGLQAGMPQLVSSSADGASRTWLVTVTAPGEGTYYLSVLVQGRSGSKQPARDVLIPIRIGAAAPTKSAAAAVEPKTDANGERVLVLPAETSP